MMPDRLRAIGRSRDLETLDAFCSFRAATRRVFVKLRPRREVVDESYQVSDQRGPVLWVRIGKRVSVLARTWVRCRIHLSPPDDLQPSQLYLCDEKLATVIEWFDADDSTYEPIQVAAIDGDLVVLDGHHRAFAARLAGADDVCVVRASDFDPAPYRTCREWCLDAGIESIDDLVGRVLDRERYEELWIDRCQTEV